MNFSSGINQALREAFVWCLLVILISISLAFHKEIILGMSQVVQIAEDSYRKSIASNPQNDDVHFDRVVKIPSNRHGHFEVQAHINGHSTYLMADTGATVVALTYNTAQKLGLKPNVLNFSSRTKTANGIAQVAPVTLDQVSIGDITLVNVRAIVAEPGKLSVNLLGMSFIGKLSHIEMKNGHLILTQ